MTYIASGNIRVSGDSLPQRLGYIFAAIDAVIREHQPCQMGIENVFMARNPDSALKLGQARGAAICAAHQAGLEISEYAPREIKQALVGSGAASKEQVQHMVRRLLGIQQELLADEADGLAIAICHAQFYASRLKTGIDPSLLKRRRSRRR
jgi:crossover junction endodeoxyribonuclease RuvC